MTELHVRFELHRVPHGLNVRAFYDKQGTQVSIEESLPSGNTRNAMLRIMNLMQEALEKEAHVPSEAMSGL